MPVEIQVLQILTSKARRAAGCKLSLGLLQQKVSTQQIHKRAESSEALHLCLLFDPSSFSCFLELL